MIKDSRLILINDSYANLQEIIEKTKFGKVDGILLDLGMSSWQLEGTNKGFSFQKDEELDMRYNTEFSDLTAEKIVNEWSEDKIENILREYGEEKFSKKIARNIVEERKKARIESTLQLVEVIKKAMPIKFQHGKIHCATRTFQALRITVNDELNNLEKVLPALIPILSSGGRIVIISFHSLEDRIVKNFFKNKEEIIKILTKKPIIAEDGEVILNPRSRSAKLRAFVKT
jgi:16S rRNA (cytosine1402-N4)-methyltransferase